MLLMKQTKVQLETARSYKMNYDTYLIITELEKVLKYLKTEEFYTMEPKGYISISALEHELKDIIDKLISLSKLIQ